MGDQGCVSRSGSTRGARIRVKTIAGATRITIAVYGRVGGQKTVFGVAVKHAGRMEHRATRTGCHGNGVGRPRDEGLTDYCLYDAHTPAGRIIVVYARRGGGGSGAGGLIM